MRKDLFPDETALSRYRLDVTFGGNLENSRCRILKDVTELETCEMIHF